MDHHLGYGKYERSSEPNYHNGSKPKTVRSKYGEFQVDMPQDRNSSFEPKIVPKRRKDISGIEDKVISMYAKGMTTMQISEMIEDIYGFKISEGMVSDIVDKLLPDYRRLNKQQSIFPSPQALMKALYLSTYEIIKKWTMPIRNWGKIRGELVIMYPDRMTD